MFAANERLGSIGVYAGFYSMYTFFAVMSVDRLVLFWCFALLCHSHMVKETTITTQYCTAAISTKGVVQLCLEGGGNRVNLN